MADQKQKTEQNKPIRGRNTGQDDDPRHAPESGEPTETGRTDQQGAHGEHAGDRDESGRLGGG